MIEFEYTSMTVRCSAQEVLLVLSALAGLLFWLTRTRRVARRRGLRAPVPVAVPHSSADHLWDPEDRSDRRPAGLPRQPLTPSGPAELPSTIGTVRVVRASAADARRAREVIAEVELWNVPEGFRVWLAVERAGRYWPQEPDIPWFVERWTVSLPRSVRDRAYRLSLWLALPCEHLKIRNWLDRAAAEHHSGMNQMPGVRLDAVNCSGD